MKTIQELKEAQDKLSIFMDLEQLKEYVVTVGDVIDAFSQCLNDDEKLEIIEKSSYFARLKPYAQSSIILTINDDKIKSQIIRDTSLVESAFENYNFIDFVKTLNEESKIYVLNNPDMLKKFNISEYQIKTIIEGLSNDNKIQILSNQELVKQLGITEFNLAELLIGIKDDDVKKELAKQYELSQFYTISIIKSFSDENKKRAILEDKDNLKDRHIEEIISTCEIDAIIDFINNEQEFLESKNIKPFNITRRMSLDKQLELAEKIGKIQVSEGEKRRIFATFSNETKENMQLEGTHEKYRKLMKMESNYEVIIPKLDDDLSQYEDLDELLSVNPLKLVKNEEDRQKLIQLCKICPNMGLEDNLMMYASSTSEEYIKGEEWISTVLQGIQEEWTDVQKLAYIDTMIGKKISYTPNFGTEVESTQDARALWKIIASGYGVCNGISQVEEYLLSKAGIEAERVSGRAHCFLKVKNIQIPTENGIVQGDTLLDPTWNLTASRYGCRPQHFCKSYDELRKVDIDSKGVDHECHKNDDLEQATTINMDTQTLREVYKSIGIADKDGDFPIKNLLEQARKIDETSTDMQSNIKSKFEALKRWCPEFATCQNSTIDILKSVLFENNEHFNFKRCVASRVYSKQDAKKQAVLYVYMDLEDAGKQFFYADKELGEFLQLSQEEFEKRFDCYDADLEKFPGNKRPWESNIEIEHKKENSSGEVIAEEGR